MENLILEATANTPAIRFDKNGRLLIEGRSLPENVTVFYNPLIEWVTYLKADTTKVDINLEYANSASSKKLLEILKVLDANNAIRELIVNWHYEVDDEDALENGQIYEELLRKASFRYHEYSEVA
ncbi:MAG: DUF1987 domain-containing protein [Bacteroidales bacterium]|nr:DUF1987 domain-containing protein [Bacteroidales bacterium]